MITGKLKTLEVTNEDELINGSIDQATLIVVGGDKLYIKVGSANESIISPVKKLLKDKVVRYVGSLSEKKEPRKRNNKTKEKDK